MLTNVYFDGSRLGPLMKRQLFIDICSVIKPDFGSQVKKDSQPNLRKLATNIALERKWTKFDLTKYDPNYEELRIPLLNAAGSDSQRKAQAHAWLNKCKQYDETHSDAFASVKNQKDGMKKQSGVEPESCSSKENIDNIHSVDDHEKSQSLWTTCLYGLSNGTRIVALGYLVYCFAKASSGIGDRTSNFRRQSGERRHFTSCSDNSFHDLHMHETLVGVSNYH
jgi:hypothetical protein